MTSDDTNHCFTPAELARLDKLWASDLTLAKITYAMRRSIGVRLSEAEVRRAALRNEPVVVPVTLEPPPDHRPRVSVWKPKVRDGNDRVRLVRPGTHKVPVGGYRIGRNG